MSDKASVLAFAGSLRRDSYNKRLAALAADAARTAGGDVTLLDLRDYPMPIYDGDVEAESGIPEPARQLKQLMIDHDGLLIASPEYNSSITAALKNAIDWVSRPEPGEPPLVAFVGKVAALFSASPGALGGLRGLVHLRAILGNINVLVLPRQLAVGKANEAFGDDGSLRDDNHSRMVRSIARELVEVIEKLKRN